MKSLQDRPLRGRKLPAEHGGGKNHMIYQIQGYPASMLCFDEERGIIYMESSGVRSLRFPALDNAVEISTMQNASLFRTMGNALVYLIPKTV